MTPQEYLAYFDGAYAGKLSQHPAFNRAAGFRKLFETLLAKKQSEFRILETGTLRKAGEWMDGQSSLLFYDFITCFGGTLTSIDTDAKALTLCKQVLTEEVRAPKEGELTLIRGDSVAVLEGMQERLDLVYLDSMDLDPYNPTPSMVHHLKELASLRGIIEASPGLIIAVDDNTELFGKGKFVAEWARQTGKEFLYEGYQIIVRL